MRKNKEIKLDFLFLESKQKRKFVSENIDRDTEIAFCKVFRYLPSDAYPIDSLKALLWFNAGRKSVSFIQKKKD